MAITKPVQIKPATLTSSDIVSFDGGLDERGDYNIAPNTISYGRNAMINSANNVTKRLSKNKWLPDVTAFNSEVATIYYGGEILYFIADNGKVKYCRETDTAWTDCGGSNTITTTADVITTFLRVNDIMFCMNGVDELRFITLSTLNMTIFTHVNDPTSVMTATATGITASGGASMYYGITYNSDGGGETAVGPILTQAVSKSRTTWKADGTEYLTLSFNDTPPAGATSRNLYAAIALQGTVPVASDLAMLKPGIPIANTTFVDNGQTPFDISYNTAPDTNSTRGIKAKSGVMAGATPVLYGDPDNPYDLYFGGITAKGVSFGANNGAQRLPLMKGTNFYPTSVIGFRNNQNIPNLIALFSGTDGVSRQQVISQKTLSYGNATINYWGADDLNTGAGALYSSYATVSYLNQLLFPSSDGVVSIKTDSRILGVLSPTIVSKNIAKTYATIKNAEFSKIVGTAWNNLIFYTIPSQGYNYNNQIAVYDLNNVDKPKWAIWDLPADWIGTISPPSEASFVYIRQGGKFFKLTESYVAEDENSDGTTTAYPVEVDTSLKAFSGGRNVYMAVTQAVVYLGNFVGTVTVDIAYINNKGRTKHKSKTFTNGSYSRNTLAGWANPRLLYQSFNNRIVRWSTQIPTSGENSSTLKITKRCAIRLPNPVVNEVKAKITSDLDNTSFDVVGANFEGVTIGVVGDIR